MSQNNSAADVVRPIISPINNSDSSTDRQDDPPPNGDSLPQPPVPPQPPENRDENLAQPPLPSGNDFPSILTCPISQEPPARPVTFLGHRQVFEHSQLWRYIKSSATSVRHPTTRRQVDRVSAIGRIALVSDPDRSRILQERIALGLGPEEDDPLSSDERTSYVNAMGHSTLPPPPPSESNNNTQQNAIRMRDIMHIDTSDSSDSSESEDDILINLREPAHNVGRRTGITTNASGGRARSNSNAGRIPIRIPITSFLTNDGTAIRSAEHASAILALLQTASAHQDGVIATLGSGARTAWVTANIDSLYRGDGAMCAFRPISVAIFMRKLREAQLFARRIFDGDHSNDQTGANHEEVPSWVRAWFQFFEAQQNQETNHARASRARVERASTVASLVGRQAPLGVTAGSQPAQVRNETARNEGPPDMREQTLGDHETERVNVSVEGRDDAGRRTSANRGRVNGSRRRNVHTASFSAGDNNPSARFENIRNGYDSLNRLTDAISHSFVTPQQRQQQTPSVIEIVRNYAEISSLLANAATPDQEQFYRNAQIRMHAQLAGIAGSETNEDANGNPAE